MKKKPCRSGNALLTVFLRLNPLKCWLQLSCFCLALLFHTSSRAFDTDNSVTPQQLAECIMGPGITVNNAVFTGSTAARGVFGGGTADGLDIDHGVILSTGKIAGEPDWSTDNNADEDVDMSVLLGVRNYDAAVLEFDIATSAQTLDFNYIFASIEYTEYIGSYNDVMAIFIDQENVALVPGTTDYVAVNTITPSVNSTYYIDNLTPRLYSLPFDGFTTKLTATKAVTAGTHHVKIVICDARDSVLDSAVFIEGSCTPGCNPPIITRQPKSAAPCSGTTVRLRAEATGRSPLTYQWKKNGVVVVDGFTPGGAIIEGATTATLSLLFTTSAEDGEYQLFVNSPCGTATSQIAIISVENGRFVAADSGSTHQLFLREDGILWAAGNNVSGQLGTGVGSASSELVQVANLTDVTSMSAGGGHSLAIVNGGAVWAWGPNGSGRLGDGTTTQRATPVQVLNLSSGVTAVSAGYDFSLALKDGNVWAWGNNSGGKLGDGTTVSKSTPVQLPASAFDNNSVIAVSAGQNHGLAITSDGILWAWGIGFLGNNSTTGSSVPVALSAASFNNLPVIAISAGDGFSLALTEDGTVWSWGYNAEGECGNGTTVNQLTPTPIILTGAIAIAAGSQHGLAAMNDGTVQTWGANVYGQLGQGTTSAGSLTPVSVNGFSSSSGWTKAVSVAAGANSSLVVADFNIVLDWGINISGMLGDGTAINRSSPVLVTHAGPPHIDRHVQNPTEACLGNNVTLSVKANGSQDLKYVWEFNGIPIRSGLQSSGAVITGAKTDTLTITGVTFADAGTYVAYVIGSCGEEPSEATLIVYGPQIVTQPVIGNTGTGQYTITVAASGTDPLTYQWYRNGTAISGAVLDTYTVPAGEFGDYYVIVSATCGTVRSDTVTINSLINIQFGEPSVFKTGKAGTGNSDDDYWNTLPVPDKGGGSTVSDDLLNGDQNVTSITVTVDNAEAGSFVVATDPLLNSYYNVPAGGQIDISINNLPMGTYDIYLYGISGPFGSASQRWNAEFSIVSGVGNTPPVQPLATSPSIAWDINSWVEGNQYVVFRDLHTIGSYAPVVIAATSDASHSFMPFVNGLQIVRTQ